MLLAAAGCGTKPEDPPAPPAPGSASPAPSSSTGADSPDVPTGVNREEMPKVIRWGSASTGSAGYVIITAFSDVVSKHVTDFRSSSMSTSGGAENIRLMASGDIDFGQTTSSDLVKAANSMEPYETPITIYQVVGYRTNAYIIHVLEKSGLNDVMQLDGKKVAVGPASGSGRSMVEPGMANLGISPEFVYGSWDECAEMLKAEQCDAVVFPIVGGTQPTSAVIQLEATAKISVIPMTKEQAETMCKDVTGVSTVDVPGGYLGLSVDKFYAMGYHNALGVRPEMNEEAVYTVLKTLFENVEELYAVSSDLDLFSVENAFTYMLPEIPVHPGAAKLYKEMGIWNDAYTIGE